MVDLLLYMIVSILIDPNIKQSQVQPSDNYTVKIPHIIPDLRMATDHVKVRYGDIHDKVNVPMMQIKRKDGNQSQTDKKDRTDSGFEDDVFDINDNHVTIETRKLDGLIVTVEGVNCCIGSALMSLIGSLEHEEGNESTTTLKAYFSSVHSKIKDYEMVSIQLTYFRIFYFSFFKQIISKDMSLSFSYLHVPLIFCRH